MDEYGDQDNQAPHTGRTIQMVSDDTGKEYVFRWPNNGHIGRYSREAMGGNVVKASRNMVLALVLQPPKEDLVAQFEDKPGLPVALANEINKRTGLNEEFTAKN